MYTHKYTYIYPMWVCELAGNVRLFRTHDKKTIGLRIKLIPMSVGIN